MLHLTIIQTTKTIDNKRPVPEFISNELKGLFFASHLTIFSLESFEKRFFFSCTKMQKSVTWWPILTHKTLACVAYLCLHTAWPGGEESFYCVV